MKKLSILIPVYNEAKTVLQVLDKVSKASCLGLEKELIVVDDGSSDGTTEVLSGINPANYRAKIYFHKQNQGKGAALRTAQQYASGDIILIQDADLEYDPNEYEKLLKPIINGEVDVVYGSRLSKDGAKRDFRLLQFLANKFLSLLTTVLYGCEITDMETCYKVFRAEIFKAVQIKSNRFDFEPEITAKVLRQGVRLKELPISYDGRAYHEGKKITWIDGFGAIWALIRFRFVS